MLRLLKTLLLPLLMLALPIQGLAASIGTSCGATHRHELISSFISHQDASGARAGGHQHASREVPVKAAFSLPHAVHDDTGDQADSHGTASTCSACAACCVGAVIPPTLTSHAPAEKAMIAPIPASLTPQPGFIPEGPMRPPRSFLL